MKVGVGVGVVKWISREFLSMQDMGRSMCMARRWETAMLLSEVRGNN